MRLRMTHVKNKCRSIRALFVCAKGATAIEFALLAPVLLMLTMGVVEFSIIGFATNAMEGAAAAAARIGQTGYVDVSVNANNTRANTIRSVVLQNTGGLFADSSALVVTPTAYASFSTINQGEPCIPITQKPPCGSRANVDFVDINGDGIWNSSGDSAAGSYGNSGDIVVYTITYQWPIMTPLLQPFFTNGIYTITSRSVVRNEPFAVGGR